MPHGPFIWALGPWLHYLGVSGPIIMAMFGVLPPGSYACCAAVTYLPTHLPTFVVSHCFVMLEISKHPLEQLAESSAADG